MASPKLPTRAFFNLPAPAKLNLFLHVVGRRTDGRHLLQSALTLIDLCDDVTLIDREDGAVRRNGDVIGAPELDLCVRAAEALRQETGCNRGAEISVRKRIPAGAGRGGGSTEAATTLMGLNALWRLGLNRNELARIGLSLGAYRAQGLDFDMEAVATSVVRFFQGRLVAIAREEGIRPDTIEAVSAVGVVDPIEYMARAHALEDARSQSPELFDDLATAYARAAHLGDAKLGAEVDAALLGPAEQSLYDACEQGSVRVSEALARDDYAGALAALAELKAPIDRFFEDVLVMDEDTAVRENRLRLLNRFVEVFVGVADIGALSKKK